MALIVHDYAPDKYRGKSRDDHYGDHDENHHVSPSRPNNPANVALFSRIAAIGSSSRVQTLLVALIALSVALGPIASHLWGSGNVAQSMVLALIVLAGIGFYFGEPRRMWSFLTPVWLIHAGMVIYDGVTAWGYRADGLAGNPNVAAGFLVLGIIWFMPPAISIPRVERQPLPTSQSSTLQAAPAKSPREQRDAVSRILTSTTLVTLLVALPFTQSRLAIAVLVLVGLVAYRPKLTPRMVALGVAAVGIGLTLTMSFDRIGPEVLLDDLAARLPILRIPRPWPVGHIDDSDLSSWDTPRVETMHNVPVKLATELGIGAGLAWVALTMLALRKQGSVQPVYENGGFKSAQEDASSNPPRKTCPVHFYMLLAVALLSMLDFYPFTVMGWAWWALVRPKA